jgi:hypothetical protein
VEWRKLQGRKWYFLDRLALFNKIRVLVQSGLKLAIGGRYRRVDSPEGSGLSA